MTQTPSSPSNLLLLPIETWDHICSFLPKPSLSRLRLVSSKLNEIALPWTFKSILLEADNDSVERFVNIAKSPKLRALVHELTIDTWIGPGYAYKYNHSYPFPIKFMISLPYARCFGRVTALHLRFNEVCGEDGRSDTIEETWNFRYLVLDTICHCITGMWTLEKQLEMSQTMRDEMEFYEPELGYSREDLDIPQDQAMPLRELTIANLADYYHPELSASSAWQKVIALPSLVDLKLFIATEEEEASPESAIYFEEKYEFFDALPYSWLSPSMTDNLSTLSLYYRDYWGWFPKVDFRAFGEDSPFPQLKVLALGNFVFSHDWQIDWFPSVGRKNGSDGLQELYLDDCPILYQSRQNVPFEEGTGYPDWTVVAHGAYNPEEAQHSLRWHHILSQWAVTMKGLKDPAYGDIDDEKLRYRHSYNAHRNFACPAPVDEYEGDEDPDKAWASGRYTQGAGMCRSRPTQMQYIEYDLGTGPSAWLETTNSWPAIEPFEPEEGTIARDDAAGDAHGCHQGQGHRQEGVTTTAVGEEAMPAGAEHW